jgi:hypothetical protein
MGGRPEPTLMDGVGAWDGAPTRGVVTLDPRALGPSGTSLGQLVPRITYSASVTDSRSANPKRAWPVLRARGAVQGGPESVQGADEPVHG